MKKKVTITLLAVVMTILLTGCNYTPVDLNYSYDYAIIQLPNGEVVEDEISSWRDYDGEQLQVTFMNGDIHLTSSIRCELIKKND